MRPVALFGTERSESRSHLAELFRGSATRRLGILGGGQLGRMLAISARGAGLRVSIRTDDGPLCPAAQVADEAFLGDYGNRDINDRFLASCDVVTAEFENLPVELLEYVDQRIPLRPGADALTTCQHRIREKRFLFVNGIPHAEFAVADSAAELTEAVRQFGGNAIAKSAAFGYDGKGQHRFASADTNWDSNWGGIVCEQVWELLGSRQLVVERTVHFDSEISVVGARSVHGAWAAFPACENVHTNGVLDYSISPARVSESVVASSEKLARTVADKLEYVGVLAVEMFVVAGNLVVNEIAPRPHNSGHHTIDAFAYSQFDQQLATVMGFEPLPVRRRCASVMLNMLGDRWAAGPPRWELLNSEAMPHIYPHLYGKTEARPGRKMGHLTVCDFAEATVTEDLLEQAISARDRITR